MANTDVIWSLVYFICLYLLSYQFGILVTWTVVLTWMVFKFFRENRREQTQLQLRKDVIQSNKPEHCEWLNMILRKFWITCGEAQFQQYYPHIIDKINAIEPKLLGSVKLLEEYFSLGKNPPIITRVETQSFLPDNFAQFDVFFEFQPDCNYYIRAEPFFKAASVSLELSALRISGAGRLTLDFSEHSLKSSICTFSILGNPNIDCKLRFLSMDMMSLPGINDWVRESITNNISTFVWPRQLRFDLLGNIMTPNTDILPPIVEIGVAFVGEEIPPGWELVHRSVTGYFSADLNRGPNTTFKECFFCYRRAGSNTSGSNSNHSNTEEELKPITGISIIFYDKSETPASTFTPITRSVGGAEANLNDGGWPTYVCFSRRSDTEPIYHIEVFNKTCEHQFPEQYNMLQYTPTGRKANLNKGKKSADTIFLLYQGGYKSPFGYHQPVAYGEQNGFLEVRIISALNLKASDVGGLCSAHAGMFTSSGMDKVVSKVKRTRTIDKNTNPKWDETFMFRISPGDNLNAYIYNKVTSIKDELIGVIRLPLDTLAMGVTVTGWYDLQLSPQGQVLMSLTPINFGLKESWQSNHTLNQLDVGKTGKKIRKFRLVADRKVLVNNLRTVTQQVPSNIAASLRAATKTDDEHLMSTLTNSDEHTNDAEDNISLRSASQVPITAFAFTEKRGFLEFITIVPGSKKPKASKRWIALKDGQLSCYKTVKEKNPTAVIDLKFAQFTLDECTRMTIKSLNDKWELRAADPKEADEWANAIRSSIGVSSPMDTESHFDTGRRGSEGAPLWDRETF